VFDDPSRGRDTMNTAARLLHLMRKIRDSGHQDQRARDRWMQVFSIPEDVPDRHLLVFENLVEAAKLTLLVEDQIRQIDGISDLELYTHPVRELRVVLQDHNLHSRWQEVTGRITDSMMTALTFVADRLGDTEPTIEKERLAEIRAQVEELLTETEEAAISPDLKRIIVSSLRELLNAVRTYELRGAEGVKSAVAKVVGTCAIEQASVRARTDEDRNALQRLGGMALGLGRIVLEQTVAALVGQTLKTITGG
jgi:hypothetical protein